MAPEDAELLEQARQGNDGAFAELMRRHEDRIFSLAIRMMGDRSDALDATQETFITVFRRAESFRGESAFSTWLYRIALNTCKDLLRKRDRAPVPTEESEGAETEDPSPGPDETAALRIDLARALAALPDDYREAVMLHDVGGVPYEDIATATGVAVGTVKSRISRGRRKLARLMEQRPGPAASKG